LQGDSPGWNGRKHFFNAAAEAMRRILVERARQKGRYKRGGDLKRVSLEGLEVATEADSETLLLVETALDRLMATDKFKGDIVKLRFFVGLNNAELAQVLEVSEPTVVRHWAYARAWLFQEIERLRNE
jgi:RNA polymerase sigma factor (TIGR02999 family)